MFNEALALQKERYERGEKKLGYAGLRKELAGTGLRQLLSQAARLPEVEEEGPAGRLLLPRPEAD